MRIPGKSPSDGGDSGERGLCDKATSKLKNSPFFFFSFLLAEVFSPWVPPHPRFEDLNSTDFNLIFFFFASIFFFLDRLGFLFYIYYYYILLLLLLFLFLFSIRRTGISIQPRGWCCPGGFSPQNLPGGSNPQIWDRPHPKKEHFHLLRPPFPPKIPNIRSFRGDCA